MHLDAGVGESEDSGGAGVTEGERRARVRADEGGLDRPRPRVTTGRRPCAGHRG